MINSTKLLTNELEKVGFHPVYVPVNEKKRLKVFGVEFVYLYLFGIAVAGVGWLAENFARLFTQGIWDCRFHLLPFISPYALIPFAFRILLGDPDKIAFFGHRVFKTENRKTAVLSNILCLSLICGAVFLGELAIGNMWEKFFGVQLWNYSSFPLQVTQYAGLVPSLAYGGGAYLIFRLVYKPVLRLLQNKVNFKIAKAICCTLGVAIVLDTLAMALQIIILKQPPVYWSVKVW